MDRDIEAPRNADGPEEFTASFTGRMGERRRAGKECDDVRGTGSGGRVRAGKEIGGEGEEKEGMRKREINSVRGGQASDY